jgi:hypothetical protein
LYVSLHISAFGFLLQAYRAPPAFCCFFSAVGESEALMLGASTGSQYLQNDGRKIGIEGMLVGFQDIVWHPVEL